MSEQRIRNAGHHFGRCTRCGADLVENDGRWSTAPRGFRIIWKGVPREAEPILELEDELEPEQQPEAEEAQEAEAAPVHQERRGVERRAIAMRSPITALSAAAIATGGRISARKPLPPPDLLGLGPFAGFPPLCP